MFNGTCSERKREGGMRRKTTANNYESLASGVRSSIDLFVLAERRGWFWSGWLGLVCVVVASLALVVSLFFVEKKDQETGRIGLCVQAGPW